MTLAPMPHRTMGRRSYYGSSQVVSICTAYANAPVGTVLFTPALASNYYSNIRVRVYTTDALDNSLGVDLRSEYATTTAIPEESEWTTASTLLTNSKGDSKLLLAGIPRASSWFRFIATLTKSVSDQVNLEVHSNVWTRNKYTTVFKEAKVEVDVKGLDKLTKSGG